MGEAKGTKNKENHYCTEIIITDGLNWSEKGNV